MSKYLLNIIKPIQLKRNNQNLHILTKYKYQIVPGLFQAFFLPDSQVK